MPVPVADRSGRAVLEVAGCRACPRLVAWREHVAREKRAAFRDQAYWGRPVPGFGDPRGAGAGRRARAGRPRRQPHRPDLHRRSVRRLPVRLAASHRVREPADVGPRATTVSCCSDMYITAAVRCAPPANKPTPAERDECRPYLVRELELLERIRVIVPLGAFGYEAVWAALRQAGFDAPRRAARGSRTASRCRAAASRSSARSTRASRTRSPAGSTPPMLDAVFARARELAQ